MSKITIQCPACMGTGLYKGFSEKDGVAVICSSCEGTGKAEFCYEEFTGRKERGDVNRVYNGSYGYAITDKDVTTNEGIVIRFSEGGCTYEEWKNGGVPKPIKDLYCPYVWKNKGIGNEPLEKCKVGSTGFGRISECRFYSEKSACWDEYFKKHTFFTDGLAYADGSNAVKFVDVGYDETHRSKIDRTNKDLPSD